MARPKRYANEAEKQAAYRLRKKGGVDLDLGKEEAVVETDVLRTEVGSQEQEVVKLAMSPAMELTVTDAKFEESMPNYYIYGKEVKKRDCAECGKGFTTRMELNRFCSPKCKKEKLSTFHTIGRAHE